jgi:hypothetical protein
MPTDEHVSSSMIVLFSRILNPLGESRELVENDVPDSCCSLSELFYYATGYEFKLSPLTDLVSNVPKTFHPRNA